MCRFKSLPDNLAAHVSLQIVACRSRCACAASNRCLSLSLRMCRFKSLPVNLAAHVSLPPPLPLLLLLLSQCCKCNASHTRLAVSHPLPLLPSFLPLNYVGGLVSAATGPKEGFGIERSSLVGSVCCLCLRADSSLFVCFLPKVQFLERVVYSTVVRV